MNKLNLLWAVVMGGCMAGIVYVTGEKDGTEKGIGLGLGAGIALGQDMTNATVKSEKPEGKKVTH